MPIFLGYIDPGTGYTILSAGAWGIAAVLGFLSLILWLFKNTYFFIKNNGKIFLAAILILSILGIITTGIIMRKNKSSFNGKIIILGFDGLSPEIIEPMMEKNELPNFLELKKIGSYRHLTTTNPPQSPVAWAAFATGKNPGKNGVFDFILRNPKDYSLSLSLSELKKGKPKKVIKEKSFWHFTSNVKVPTVIIQAPLTFPPEKIFGKMLSGMGVPDILGTEGTFTFYTSQELDKEKEIGGNVFHVKRNEVIILNLIGPRIASLNKRSENVKIPFRVTLQEDKVEIKIRSNKILLKVSQWSDWQEAIFKIGPFRKMRGIFKFYLLETKPEFKLYISPINFDPRDPYFHISYPGDYSRYLTKNIGLYHTQGMPIDTWSVNENRLSEEPLLEECSTVFQEKKAMLELELSHFKKGVLFCYFGSTDTIQHMFWRYTDPDNLLYEIGATNKYKEAIRNYYKLADTTLGKVMKNLNSSDTLIVLSDHGFAAFRKTVHVNSWLRQNGYLELKSPLAESGKELLADIDWGKTKAYAIGFGAIYINQKGREGEGIVNPGEDTEKLKTEICRKLKEWKDEKNNSFIIHEVYKNEQIFWGKYAQNAPDIYIGFNIGYRASWQTALGGIPKEEIEDNLRKWSGDHLFDPSLVPGIIFSNKNISSENPAIYDIAPTILKIIGYKLDTQDLDFDGKPLF